MGVINLADAKVSYEGQTLPAINLISRLQTQLRETACRIATIAETLGDLQTALLNSHTVEVKLTLSKEDYGRFKSMEGVDDSERIRNAILTLLRDEAAAGSSRADESRPSAPVAEPLPSPPAASASLSAETAEPITPPAPAQEAVRKTSPEPTVAPDSAIKKRATTRCPTCQSMIELPETFNNDWPVELKCGNCGAKCLMKPSFRKQWTNYSI